MSNTYTIEDFLRAVTHTDVINMMLEVVDTTKFNVYTSTKYTFITPKEIVKYVPLLSAHTDTVHKVKPTKLTNINGTITNPNGGLGADDRAGCYIMYLLLLSGVAEDYMYILTDEEEIGGVGGYEFVNSQVFEDIVVTYASCFIGLDRKGSSDCASYGYDNEALIDILSNVGYLSTYGSFTDVMTFSQYSHIACVNLSIGYYKEHTKDECLVVDEMMNTYNVLLDLCADLWENQYVEESVPYTNYSYNDYDNKYVPIVCDQCGKHTALYDYGWGNICEDCIIDLESNIEV